MKKSFLYGFGLTCAFMLAFLSYGTTSQRYQLVDVEYVKPTPAMSTAHKRQRMAQQQGELQKCETPESIVAEAKAGAKDEYGGSHVLTSAEVATLLDYVMRVHGAVWDIDTVVVVYLKTAAIIFSGKGGVVCTFEVVDGKALKDFLGRVLGQRA